MRDLNTLPLPELLEHLIRGGDVDQLFAIAAREDLGDPAHDVTSEALIATDLVGAAHFRARAPGVVAGLAILPKLARHFAPNGVITAHTADGEEVAPGMTLAEISGPLRELLAFERTALNLLSRLSGVASLTRAYVKIAQSEAPNRPPRICDTRKTTPGWRPLEKYAVRCGGGWLHRAGLHDAMLIKDNHLWALQCGSDFSALAPRIEAARQRHDLRFVELEVDSLAQLSAALAIAPGLIDIILLDNMSVAELREAVARRNAEAPEVQLEASGGVSLATIGAIAKTGVDRVSVGALTHSAPALDLGLDCD